MKSTNYIQESGVRHRHLVAKFENNGARGSRFERVGSQMLKGNGQIGFPLRNFFFLIFLRPQGTFWTKESKKSIAGLIIHMSDSLYTDFLLLTNTGIIGTHLTPWINKITCHVVFHILLLSSSALIWRLSVSLYQSLLGIRQTVCRLN